MSTDIRTLAKAHAHASFQASLAGVAGVSPQRAEWPENYTNSETGKQYEPHHEEEAQAVYNDSPRYLLFKGGEGGGKSVAGIIKDLNRLRRGMDGIMVSPDFEHFKKSLWPEFRRWCPPSVVVERERYRLSPQWEPQKSFALHFISEIGTTSTLYCGGIEDPSGWEGPNVNFAHPDEARRHKDAQVLKVLDGRVRIPGPNGEPPQMWLTSTPKKHWLYDYFGPLQENDERAAFKADSLTITLLTEDNERAGNLQAGFTKQRRQSLTEAEARVLLEAGWEDIDTTERFLPSITLWDACYEDLPPLSPNTPLVLAADAAVSGDTFGLVGISRHPSRVDAVAVRLVMCWNPLTASDEYIDVDATGKRQLNFVKIEEDIVKVCKDFNVLLVAYDPTQLHHLMKRIEKAGIVQTIEVKQNAERLVADKQLLDLILQRQIAHDGNKLLRQHLDNADRKIDQDRKLRIVKREEKLKIDLAVSASMACYKESILPPPVPSGYGLLQGSVKVKTGA